MFAELKKVLGSLTPSLLQLRIFGLLISGILLLIWYRWDGTWAWALGLFGLFVTLLLPSLWLNVSRALMVLTFPIGWLLSKILLGLLFFLIITPMGIYRRITGIDHCNGNKKADTWWSDIEQNEHHDKLHL